jgi:ketosteroid isomerase-like protein
MSQANVDELRRGFAAWNVALNDPDEPTWRDAMAEMLDGYHPEAVVDFSRTVPDFPTTPAREAMAAWVEDARGTFATTHVEAVEMLDVGEAVMAAIRVAGAGALSGASLEAEFFYVFRYRDEQIISATTYESRQEALKAVGLAE